MQIRLEHIVEAIKALQKAEEAIATGIGESRAMTDCKCARWALESAIGSEAIAVLEH